MDCSVEVDLLYVVDFDLKIEIGCGRNERYLKEERKVEIELKNCGPHRLQTIVLLSYYHY